MKTVWFYGCSLTAGDELADKEFFPWKAECKDVDEYHRRRSEIFNQDAELDLIYQKRNKELSYPKKIENSSNFKTVNQAENGSSLKTMIVKSMEDIFCKKSIDFIVFQIPIYHRELFLTEHYFSSLQMSNPNLPSLISEYRKIKLKSHLKYQQSFEDFTDLIMYDSFLNEKKIPYVYLFINESEYQFRFLDLQKSRYRYIDLEFKKNNKIFLAYGIPNCDERELAGHMNDKSHSKLAKYLKIYIENYYESLS